MGKIHSGLQWLTADEAVEHLGYLLGEEVTLTQLMRQCANGNCKAYLEPPPQGESVLIETGGTAVTGPKGDHHLIYHSYPATWGSDQDLGIWLKGDVHQFDFAPGGGALLPPDQRFGCRELSDAVWFVRLKGWQFEPRFKCSDIEALAAKMNGVSAPAESAEKPGETAETKGKPSHLLAIAALLELLTEPVEHPRPQGRKQAAIKEEILQKFPWRGLSKRSLEGIFSAANKAKADAK